MNAYNLTHNLYKARQAEHTTLADPGSGGTVKVSPQDLNILVVASTGARTLQAASEIPVGTSVLVISQAASVTVNGLAIADGEYTYFVVTLDASGNERWTVTGGGTGSYEVMTVETGVDNTATVTTAQLLKRIIDAVPTAAATFTLPTAALLVAAIPGAKVGDSFTFLITNNSAGANTITVAAGSGGTADGTLTVAQNVARLFLVTLTDVGSGTEAYTVYGIE